MSHRPDNIGFFWQDVPIQKERGALPRVMPDIPDTGWKRPRDFPNLSSAGVIALDCETYDPELLTSGPGWARGRGHIVGVSLAVPGGFSWYFPMRHEVRPEENMDPDMVLAWLRDILKVKNTPKIGANLLYDIGWLRWEGVDVSGPFYDVQFAEALLTESGSTSLDAIGEKYLGKRKEVSLLYKWCSDFYGGEGRDQRKNIYRAPPSLVGPYAEKDAVIPLEAADNLWEALNQEGLLDLFYLECRLIPLLLDMRFAGVKVDLTRAEELQASLGERVEAAKERLNNLAGFAVQPSAADSVAKAFRRLGLPHKETSTGRPSFTKQFLQGVDHPFAKELLEVRRLDKLRSTFIESYVFGNQVDGKIYGQFHPLRGGSAGTRSGRFSSSTPNLQNLPSRDDELARHVRGLFIPDDGHAAWRSYDYSQIEYRFLVHYAVGDGAEAARRLYRDNPATDYHEMALELVAPVVGWDISTESKRKVKRKPIKGINFGLIYGMGLTTLANQLSLSPVEAKQLFEAYHKSVPFAKATMDECMQEAERYGHITTFLGRKSRFDLWEAAGAERTQAYRQEEALRLFGSSIKRAYLHKALNRRLQGSAADLMKAAMLRCYEDGVFAETGVPRLTVHDELDFSDPGGVDEAFLEMQRVMESAISLRVPILAEGLIGKDWGNCKQPIGKVFPGGK
jgi:DNA polymerase I-like protein with 3'-5' exonuclease and polymerase domains